jgi:hypothetical protein
LESVFVFVAGQRRPQIEPLLVPYQISAQGSGASAAISHAVKQTEAFVTRGKILSTEIRILLFFVWEKLAGTAVFKVTDMIYVDTGQRDKWREFGTKAVLKPESSFLNCEENNVYLDKGG